MPLRITLCTSQNKELNIELKNNNSKKPNSQPKQKMKKQKSPRTQD